MLIINNKALKITNKWLNPVAGSGPTPPGPTPPTYYHVYTSATNGTITATPVSGISGTTVTLSNTPDTGYEFDSYSLTGATLYDTNKFDINNSDVNVVGNFSLVDPYNPLNLPAFTIRCRYAEGTQPRNNQGLSIITNQVSVSPNIWDITYNNTNWSNLFMYDSNIIEVLGANTTGVINMFSTFESANILETLVIFDTSSVTNMSRTFASLERLTSLPLYDTSNVTTMYNICGGDSNLTYIPLFNTAKVTDVRYAFQRCKKVETGALALYQQMSTQTNPPTQHSSTFADCGSNTVNGAAELAQIPSNWK